MDKIIFSNGSQFALAETSSSPVHSIKSNGYTWERFHILGSHDDIEMSFTDNASYRREWESESVDESGNVFIEKVEQDLSGYCISGEIVNLRDGTFFVYMRGLTDEEKLIDSLILAALGGVE